ncbi:MAG: hypothetical protein RL386_369, partial [Bacteroidota bacterium]
QYKILPPKAAKDFSHNPSKRHFDAAGGDNVSLGER